MTLKNVRGEFEQNQNEIKTNKKIPENSPIVVTTVIQ